MLVKGSTDVPFSSKELIKESPYLMRYWVPFVDWHALWPTFKYLSLRWLCYIGPRYIESIVIAHSMKWIKSSEQIHVFHSVYAPSQWETALQCNASLIGWAHAQNDRRYLRVCNFQARQLMEAFVIVHILCSFWLFASVLHDFVCIFCSSLCMYILFYVTGPGTIWIVGLLHRCC